MDKGQHQVSQFAIRFLHFLFDCSICSKHTALQLQSLYQSDLFAFTFHIHQYQVPSQLPPGAINITRTISSSQLSGRPNSLVNSSLRVSMADPVCSRCRVTLSIATFEQAFNTKSMQHNTTISKPNKQNLAKLCEAVHPRQQISCYQQQPEHAEPFSSVKTRSECVRCGGCQL